MAFSGQRCDEVTLALTVSICKAVNEPVLRPADFPVVSHSEDSLRLEMSLRAEPLAALRGGKATSTPFLVPIDPHCFPTLYCGLEGS